MKIPHKLQESLRFYICEFQEKQKGEASESNL